MVGTGQGARAGILVKNAEALERAERITVLALDKTGTLTCGTPQVTDVVPRGIERAEALRLAAALEQNSEHPLARAIVAEHLLAQAQEPGKATIAASVEPTDVPAAVSYTHLTLPTRDLV